MEEVKEENKKNINKILNNIKDSLLAIVIGLSIGIIVKNFFYLSIVSGESMNDTLQDKDWCFVVNEINTYNRGDIVIAKITIPEKNKSISIIKRIIGLPGDTIEIKDNKVYVNDKEIIEDYIKEEMKTNPIQKYTLKPGEFWIMGDNRNNSYDSRFYGVVKREQLYGEVKGCVSPLSLIASID